MDSKGYHSYNDTVAGGVSSASVQIAAKFQSLNAILFALRDGAKLNSATTDSVSHRERRGVEQFQCEIAGQLYPPQPITSKPENISNCAAELYKVFRALGVSNQMSSLTDANFVVDEADGTTTTGSFLAGISFENYGSTSGQLMDGVNSLGTNVQVNLTGTITKNQSGGSDIDTSIRIDCFAMHDQVLTIEPQTGIAQMIF